MPPRDQELPEGTDQIINGAMETGAGAGASTGSSGSSGDYGSPGGDTGLGSTGASGSAGLGGGGNISEQARGGVQSLKSQATDRVRSYAEDGKSRATSALDDLAQLVQETAQSIDDKIGPQYGDYARRAAGTVTDFSERLRGKEVDELFDDAREIVRKSPGVAIGVAAVAGFALVRLLKAGMDAGSSGGTDVEFTPDAQLSSGTGSMAGSTSVDSQAPFVAPGTGV
jgi:ElaB/YqjD/DUF883 family membrane-anchored ribosome-binding protein